MNAIWQALAGLWVAMALLMSVGWWWQRRHGNAGIVDVLWALGVGGSAVALAIAGDGALLPRVLLALFGGLWALRLAWHLGRRVFSESEDGRYRALREHWRGNPFYFFLFFQFQALLVVLFSLPFLAVAANPVAGLTPQALLGALLWLGSLSGEAVADRQLARFRADAGNRGKTCRDGLWRYSRHPNYFFEWLHWFVYLLLAIGSPLWWLALSGPVVMYVFLRWLSGVPFTEQQALRSRGDDYRRYQESTPMLIPWFPKRDLPS